MSSATPVAVRSASLRDAFRILRYVTAILLLIAAGGFVAVCGNPYTLVNLTYLLGVFLLVPFVVLYPTGVLPVLAQAVSLLSPAVVQLALPISLGFLASVSWPRRRLFGMWSGAALDRLRTICVTIAVVVPVGFAVIRFAWAIGVPLGIDERFRATSQAYVNFGVACAVAALLLAFLTWGLTRPWSARLPSGRPIRVGLVRNSAVVVGTAAIASGSFFIRTRLVNPAEASTDQQQVGTWVAEVSSPLWGVALIVAGLVYAELRRRNDHPQAVRRPVG
ncbi:hypothetical protein EK0264_12660 [Epidermidibacterium keratini]|uniref:Uncharacterized protein n=1 Tax=Epidermidibacterium keratini TaxID=1891644 RepID=A0A7L4YPS1_9ACTN|nr:hypothetical protein [Epidermidibacterium keratini]QHC01058.1 hypothetical protein EK0264_12660 [Epidermidibacterium keratini]